MPLGRLIASFVVLLSLAVLLPAREVSAAPGAKYRKTFENYAIPDVTLVNQDGARVSLRTLLNSKKVVMVDFIFTTCTTICPVLSAGFANFQKKMGADNENFHLVSISIDPEHDTPQRMKEYLRRYDAKPGWNFLTGKSADIRKVLVAFQANTTSDKMYHRPLALLHARDSMKWVRIYGLLGTSDLVAEYRELLGR